MSAKIIDQIKVETRNVKWIVDQVRNGQIKTDNSFQRRYVWLKKHQVKLIETILLGYSIPEIYLWNTGTDPETGETVYSIVDGQQRIGAITNFINGDFNLQSSYLTNSKEVEAFTSKCFNELSSDERVAVWAYPLSIRFINEDVVRENIVTMFLRLNSTDLSLNPQELRNAEFNGKFLRLAEELSQNSFWEEYKVFTSKNVRRMEDIQFISTILMFLRMGVEEDTSQKSINKAYDQYNEIYEDYDNDKKTVEQLLANIKNFCTTENTKKFLSRLTHLYMMLVITYFLLQKYGNISKEVISAFENFVNAYDDQVVADKLFTSTQRLEIEEYKKLSSEGTQTKSKKLRRIDLLKAILKI